MKERTKPSDKMKYYFTTELEGDFAQTVEKVTDELKNEGFGVLTQIDIQSTLKEKLGADFYHYQILGACNPPNAYKALQAEDKIGLMLPCNVIVQERKPNQIEVSAIDPVASMGAVDNDELGEVAREVGEKLKRVIDRL